MFLLQCFAYTFSFSNLALFLCPFVVSRFETEYNTLTFQRNALTWADMPRCAYYVLNMQIIEQPCVCMSSLAKHLLAMLVIVQMSIRFGVEFTSYCSHPLLANSV